MKPLTQEEFDREVRPRLEAGKARLKKTIDELIEVDGLEPYQIIRQLMLRKMRLMWDGGVPKEFTDEIHKLEQVAVRVMRDPDAKEKIEAMKAKLSTIH